MLPVDILIIGGGVQGLVLLDELTRHGYRCVLVTHSDLGSGQTLHSHGLLNSGTGLLTGQLREAMTLAGTFAHDRGLHLYGYDRWYAFLPPPAFERLRTGWDASGYSYRECSPAELPAGFREAELLQTGMRTHVIALNGYNFPKRQLVQLLARDHLPRILRGTVGTVRHEVDGNGLRIMSVEVAAAAIGETVIIAPKAVIASAGTGTKRLLRSLSLALPSTIQRVTHTKEHMICVRAPHDALPATSVISVAHGLISVAHVNRNHDEIRADADNQVTWYVTPSDPDLSHHEDAPDDAHAVVDEDLVAQGLENLLKLYPPLRIEAQRTESAIEFTVFAGFKQNLGDDPIAPLCDIVEGTNNLFVALPSVLINSWTNAQKIIALLSDRVPPSGNGLGVPGGGQGVCAGVVNELRQDVSWRPWTDIAKLIGSRAGASLARGT
jgi:glycine/D-amino acid oxidase-like deaminating enzyme